MRYRAGVDEISGAVTVPGPAGGAPNVSVPDPWGASAKRDVEVVVAGQPLAGRPRQGFSHDPAQRGLDHLGVIEEVLGHFPRLVYSQGTRREVE